MDHFWLSEGICTFQGGERREVNRIGASYSLMAPNGQNFDSLIRAILKFI